MMTILDYFDDEISIILSYAFLGGGVYRQFNMDGFGPWVWDGGDGKCCILFGGFSILFL
jgi:hypothetical protein